MGATGRNCSRPLTSLSRSRLAARLALASRLRCPRARGPVLAAALEPGHHPVGGDHLGHRLGQVGRALVGDLGRGQPGGQLVVGPAPPQGGGGHGRDPVAEGVGEVHGGAEGGAGVAGGRLHPDALERPLLGQDRVGHAVEGDPAGHGQVAVAGLGVQPADQLQQHLLEAELDAGRQVGVPAGPLLALAAPLGQGAELDRGDGEAAVAGDPDRLAQLPQVGGPPVGGQGHDLVLVRGAPEPEVVGDLLVQQTEGVGEPLGGQDLEVAVDRAAGQVGGGLAAAVQHQHARAGVGGGQVGRGGMGHVVGDVADAGRVEAGQGGAQEQRGPLGVQGAQPLPAVVGQVGGDRRGQGGVVGVGDRVQVLGGQSGLGQAPGGRPLGQLPGGEWHRRLAVLAPGEALLLGRGHHLAVDHQGGGRVVEHRVHTKDTHLVILCTIGWRRRPSGTCLSCASPGEENGLSRARRAKRPSCNLVLPG